MALQTLSTSRWNRCKPLKLDAKRGYNRTLVAQAYRLPVRSEYFIYSQPTFICRWLLRTESLTLKFNRLLNKHHAGGQGCSLP